MMRLLLRRITHLNNKIYYDPVININAPFSFSSYQKVDNRFNGINEQEYSSAFANNKSSYQTQTLASKLIKTEHKRFFIDVKKNDRGCFLQLSEVHDRGRRSSIYFTLGAALKLSDIIGQFLDFNKEPSKINFKLITKTD
jgi:hypothetical protein